MPAFEVRTLVTHVAESCGDVGGPERRVHSDNLVSQYSIYLDYGIDKKLVLSFLFEYEYVKRNMNDSLNVLIAIRIVFQWR
jgi:hypothetical protein